MCFVQFKITTRVYFFVYLQVAAQLRQEGDGGSSLQIRVQVLLELRRHHAGEVGEDARGDVDLAQHVHLRGEEGGAEGRS